MIMVHRSMRTDFRTPRDDTKNISASNCAGEFWPWAFKAERFEKGESGDGGENRCGNQANHSHGVGRVHGWLIAVHNVLLTAKAVPDCKKQPKNVENPCCKGEIRRFGLAM